MASGEAGSAGEVKTANLRARVVWVSQIFSLAIVSGVFATLPPVSEGFESSESLFLLIPWGVLFTAAPMAMFVRGQIFKRYWVGETVEPRGYLQGCIVTWAMIEGAGLLGAAMMFAANTGWVGLLQPLAAGAVLLSLWPNGKAMEKPGHRQMPTRPRDA